VSRLRRRWEKNGGGQASAFAAACFATACAVCRGCHFLATSGDGLTYVLLLSRHTLTTLRTELPLQYACVSALPSVTLNDGTGRSSTGFGPTLCGLPYPRASCMCNRWRCGDAEFRQRHASVTTSARFGTWRDYRPVGGICGSEPYVDDVDGGWPVHSVTAPGRPHSYVHASIRSGVSYIYYCLVFVGVVTARRVAGIETCNHHGSNIRCYRRCWLYVSIRLPCTTFYCSM